MKEDVLAIPAQFNQASGKLRSCQITHQATVNSKNGVLLVESVHLSQLFQMVVDVVLYCMELFLLQRNYV